MFLYVVHSEFPDKVCNMGKKYCKYKKHLARNKTWELDIWHRTCNAETTESYAATLSRTLMKQRNRTWNRN